MAPFAVTAEACAPRFIHASAVVIGESGVLIQGPSGAGKSSLALRLIAEAHGRGRFARLVGDDRIGLAVANGVVIARPHPAIAGLIECCTRPIARLAYEGGCVVRLVVDLVPEPLPRLPDERLGKTRILEGVELPVLRLQSRTTDFACLFVSQELGLA